MNLEPGESVGPPWRQPLRGRFEELVIESEVLRDNPLGDPAVRPLYVYTPPAVESSRPLPTIYALQGFSGQVDMWLNRRGFRATAIELFDQLFGDPAVPPCRVAMVDCWTSLGGSQFLDSPAIGRYHTYLCDEVVAFVDSSFNTLAGRDHRALIGHSSGGYGALVTSMLRPDVFGSLATHAGDALFELCYWRDVPGVVRSLRDHYDGSYERFHADLAGRPGISRPGDPEMINLWAMAAAYSADADGTVHLPFDTASGRMIDDVWQRWLAWDPVRMVPRHVDALRSLRAIYIDAGSSDEFFLDLGAQGLRDALAQVGVTDVHFDRHEGGHFGVEHRYVVAMRYLAERISTPVR